MVPSAWGLHRNTIDMMICIEMVQLLFWPDDTVFDRCYQNNENLKDEKKVLFGFIDMLMRA